MNELKKIIIAVIKEDTFTESGSVWLKYHGTEKQMIENFADNIISNLPEQIITEDRIVEVLKDNMPKGKYFKDCYYPFVPEEDFLKIAHEILQGQEWKILTKDEVAKNTGYDPDNSKIAIMEVKCP